MLFISTSVAVALSLFVVLPARVACNANLVDGSSLLVSIPPKVFNGSVDGRCPPENELEEFRNQIEEEIRSLLQPSYSCSGTRGWSRYFYLNSTNVSEQCPPPLIEHTYNRTRVCGRRTDVARIDCESVILRGNYSGPYSQVCGRIIGYQYGGTQSFGYYAELRRGNPANTIDQYYVDGATLTHGPAGGREHIWTFATGLAESHDEYACPCALSGLGRYNANPPPYVGDDYFCETGVMGAWPGSSGDFTFYGSDPLWDGDGCSAGNACCSLNNPPYFSKHLSANTTDDIEMRICGRERIASGGDTLIQLIELYVK